MPQAPHEKEEILKDQIGRLSTLSGPFGDVPLVYADWTASGRGLQRIEDFVQRNMLPMYGNTHTATSACGIQSSLFVEEARRIVGEFCAGVTSGKAASDAVLFTGFGATWACCQLVRFLVKESSNTTIFLGLHEHHSNLLPWRESGAKVLTVGQTNDGRIDLKELEALVQKEKTLKRKLIGTFSAASNVTGRLAQVEKIADILKSYGGIVCFDYATMAPHEAPRLNEKIDAVFFSCHKFLGGQGAPGVLVIKKHLMTDPSQAPSLPGGGAVFYVSSIGHRYLSNKIEREQGGSPDVLNIARAGLALDLARSLSSCPHKYTTWTKAVLFQAKNESGQDRSHTSSLKLLGGIHTDDLPILPIVIQCGSRLLHFNFVCQLLNDLFGIQCRGGCQCAGPYAQTLLGIDTTASECLELALVTRKHSEMLRPGFTRLSLGATTAHTSEAEVEYIMEALDLVARYGWRLLPGYRLDATNGHFRHASRFSKPLGLSRLWLADAWKEKDSTHLMQQQLSQDLSTCLHKGRDILMAPQPKRALTAQDLGDLEPLRWYLMPHEAAERLANEEASKASEWPPENRLQGPLRLYYQNNKYEYTSLLECLKKEATATPRTAKKPLRSLEDLEKASVSSGTESCAIVSETDQESDTVPKDKLHSPPAEMKKAIEIPARVELKIERKRPPKKLLKCVGEAIRDWGLIEEGDRILLGLSGGKDSLSLLHILLHLERIAPVNFKIACATVDPQTPSFDPRPMIDYLKALGVEYFYLSESIVDHASIIQPTSLCAYCARMKRGVLYTACIEHGYNKLALAHHLDDLAESFLMNVMHNGQLRTMRAKYTAERGITVIRPLLYAREHLCADFAREVRLPVIGDNCPACFEEPKERARVKKLLARESLAFPQLFNSLRTALDPLMSDDVTSAIKSHLSSRLRSTNVETSSTPSKKKAIPVPNRRDGAIQKDTCEQ